MNTETIKHILYVLFLCAILVCGVIDYKKRIIPNVAILIMLVLGVLLQLIVFDVSRIILAIIVLTLLLVFAYKTCGAGDIKLFFVSALFLGVYPFLFSIILLGITTIIFRVAQYPKQQMVAMGAYYAPGAALILIYYIIKEISVI